VARHPAADHVQSLASLLGSLVGRLGQLESSPPPAPDEIRQRSHQINEGVSLAVSLCDALALIGDRSVTGKLYQSGQKLVRKSTVYVGNVIPDSELADMSIAAINKRMKNKFGDKRSNLKIKTGNSVPFMIVFDKLPNNLDEYTVEVASSSI
jgi:hypothetical protein